MTGRLGWTEAGSGLPHPVIAALGAVTIAAYGVWYYAFGVLLDPLLTETGWSESAVTAAFSASAALGAIGAVPAGRFADRFGGANAFLVAAVLGPTGLLVAAGATGQLRFAIGAITGGAALQAFAFYHVTQAEAVRAAPTNQGPQAVAGLTIYGAFASPLALPLAGLGVATVGWRATLRLGALLTAAVVVLGALVVRRGAAHRAAGAVRGEGRDGRAGGPLAPDDGRRRSTVAATAATPEARRYLVATGLVGAAMGVILVYQVPVMTDVGLSSTTAATLAGARGAAQVGGRIPLARIVGRIGARGAVRLAAAAVACSAALLPMAANPLAAGAFVLVAGFGIGALSPLQGIYGAELFDEDRLGGSLGVVTMVSGLAGASGPVAAGVITQATGSRWWAVAAVVACAAAAVMVLGRARRSAGPERAAR